MATMVNDLPTWIIYVLSLLGVIIALLFLNGIWIWYTRIRPRQPKLHANWASDCEFTPSAVFNDSHITFRNVRDFHWRTTKDRDEKWADEVTVDSTKVKHIWFVVDQFHALSLIHI